MEKHIIAQWRSIPREEQKFDLFHKTNEMVILESTHQKLTVGKVLSTNELVNLSEEGFNVTIQPK